jgi:iron complex transport system substrate-binding protein
MRVRPIGGIAAVVFVLTACSGSSGAAGGGSTASIGTSSSPLAVFPVTITDDDGQQVTIDAPPARIVTFAPSMTETVYAIGLGDRLVGVSGRYDDYPAAAKQVPEIGGAGEFGVDPNLEEVVSLQPDLFLTISGGDQWKQQLRDLDVPVVTLNATDLPDLLDDIRVVGLITGATDAADALASDMQERADAVTTAVSDAGGPVSCFFEVYFPPLTTVGPDTFIYDLLVRAGCDPTTSNAKADYPAWSVEKLIAGQPDVYIATPESAKSAEAVASRPGFAAIPAVATGAVFLVDSDLITRPGPRVIEGLEGLEAALHPSG